MKKVVIFLSHRISELQKEELSKKFDINEIIFLPKNLQEIWSNVGKVIDYYTGIDKMKGFMLENLKSGDYIIVQGNWGYVYEIVNFAKKNNINALYSFSYRDSDEESTGDSESIKISRYKHIKFIEY